MSKCSNNLSRRYDITTLKHDILILSKKYINLTMKTVVNFFAIYIHQITHKYMCVLCINRITIYHSHVKV